jgi:hypothetical protein
MLYGRIFRSTKRVLRVTPSSILLDVPCFFQLPTGAGLERRVAVRADVQNRKMAAAAGLRHDRNLSLTPSLR